MSEPKNVTYNISIVNFMAKGFTIIELLVVVTIISILSAVILLVSNPFTLRAKTRDAQRIHDISTISSALEIYLADNKVYPASGSGGACTPATSTWQRVDNGSTSSCLYSALVPSSGLRYMNILPTDPLGSGSTPSSPCSASTANGYYYVSSANGGTYLLVTLLEIDSADTRHQCPSLANWSSLSGGSCVVSATKCYGIQNP